MNTPMDDPLPGLEPDPVPYPEPPVAEQVHLAAPDADQPAEEGDGGAATGVDSQP